MRERWSESLGLAGVHTLYLEWITNKGLLYTTGNSAPCYVAAWVGEKVEEEGIHVYIC